MKPQEIWFPLAEGRRGPGVRDSWQSRTMLAVVMTLTLAAMGGFMFGLHRALALQNGGTAAHYAFLAISTLAFGWIAFGAMNALVGLIAIVTGKGRDTIEVAEIRSLGTRTALLFPIYHEDAVALAQSIRSLVGELADHGSAKSFSVFVLSDSQTDSARRIERAIFRDLAEEVAGEMVVFYRNREKNIGKKAGNIAEWVKTQGGGHDYFVVFDADSTMSVDTLVRLVATMENNPDTALIQTVPLLAGGETLFARLQQVANNMFGPLGAAGFATWQGASGNYWGHNAILRTEAFAACAGLPELSGKAPWGGPIQSHDFVEAALLRRAGWRVALVTSLGGSYETSPPTLVDTAVRDRRWMQGNLQHARILGAHGLAPVSRLHLAVGIISYVSSALWLAMLVNGLYLAWLETQRVVAYFEGSKTLFPNWPTYDPQAALWLLGATMLVVFLPKILGLGLALWEARTAAQPGKKMARTVVRWGAEVLHSALVAPVMMLLQVKALVEVLIGKDSGWGAQRRTGEGVTWKEALGFHGVHAVTGVGAAAVAFSISWHALLWMLPIVVGLVLSPWLTWTTSRPSGADITIISC